MIMVKDPSFMSSYTSDPAKMRAEGSFDSEEVSAEEKFFELKQ